MQLLETEQARNWLDQFEPGDIVHARRLVASMQLITRTEVENALNGLITVEASKTSEGAVAMFAIRELNPELPEDGVISEEAITADKRYRHIRIAGKKIFLTNKTRRNISEGNLEPASYFPADKSKRPASVRSGIPLGSEGPMANLIRDICRREKSPGWLDHPSLEEMKETKVRTILLVDDLIGSGSRARYFLAGFLKHPTIKSWLSFEWIKIVIVSYVATARGKSLVESSRSVTKVAAKRVLENGSPTWSKQQLDEIKRICTKYSKLTSHPQWPYGYGKAFTYLCFDYKCPNTTPVILWGSSSNWKSLFRIRPNLDFQVWPEDQNATKQEQHLLISVGQIRLSTASLDMLTAEERRSVVALAVLATRRLSTARLAIRLGVSEDECRSLLARCTARGWLTGNKRLTDAAKKLLNQARDFKMAEPDDIFLSDDYYIPQSLRASRC